MRRCFDRRRDLWIRQHELELFLDLLIAFEMVDAIAEFRNSVRNSCSEDRRNAALPHKSYRRYLPVLCSISLTKYEEPLAIKKVRRRLEED